MSAIYHSLFARMVRACNNLPSSARVDAGLKDKIRTRWFTWVDERSPWSTPAGRAALAQKQQAPQGWESVPGGIQSEADLTDEQLDRARIDNPDTHTCDDDCRSYGCSAFRPVDQATADFFSPAEIQRTLFMEGVVKKGWIDALPEPASAPLYTPNGGR